MSRNSGSLLKPITYPSLYSACGFGITPGGVGGAGGGQGPQGDGGVGTSDAGEDRLYSVSFHNKNTT